MEPYHVRILWTTMMAKQDMDHVVRANAFMLARWANMTEEEVLDGLKVLSSPDTKRLEPQENEGRRVVKVEEGWFILNGDKYEKLMRKLAEQARKAKWAREHRAQESMRQAMRSDNGKSEIGAADIKAAVEDGRPLRWEGDDQK